MYVKQCLMREGLYNETGYGFKNQSSKDLKSFARKYINKWFVIIVEKQNFCHFDFFNQFLQEIRNILK